MWTGFVFRQKIAENVPLWPPTNRVRAGVVYPDTSDDVSREGWWEKWKRFGDYTWAFTESKPTGVCIILTTTRDGKDDPKIWRLKAAEDTAPQNSCTIS